MLESLRQQHEDDLSEMENVADYGSMAQWLAHRFSMTVSALRRRNEILRMDGFYSHVEFQAYARGGAPAACQRLHGQRFALGDPAWQNWQSCGFPECACGFRGRLAKGENLPAVSAENGRNRSVNAAHAKNKPCKHHVE